MSFKDSDSDSQVLGLQEQVKCLSDELMQCQADKEFVWSLWKRLQVANPDLTQAVSLVVEREKHKAEMKDRKVLEILQIKDHKIQELEQRVTQQQDEINSSQPKRMVASEDSLSMKDLTALQKQLAEKDHQLMECRKKEEDDRQALQALERKIEGLTSHCATLQTDLGEKERQAKTQRDHEDSSQEVEEELRIARLELFNLQRYSSSLEGQISSKDKEVATAERQLTQLGHEFAEVQKLYKQSTEHAAEQSHLIRQLEGLNLDTQKVLRNTEEAHTADTTSYQKLYTELSQCYQSLISSEAGLRQRHQELGVQLAERDQHILQLQAQIQQTQQEQKQALVQETTRCSSRNRQTNFKGSPVQRSRSLSPASSVELDSGRKQEAAQRIQDLEELLQLKTVENEELRRAHEKRRERLCLLHNNYKVVRDQIKELEKTSGRPGGRTQRPEPWQLRQENSDAVWNELAYLKNLNRKLSVEKVVMEEQMDVLRVQAAMDRATVKELRTFLQDEHQELVHNVVEEPQVKLSTPKKPSVSSEQMEPSFKKMQQMEWRIMSINKESERLREEKEQLLEDNKELALNCRKLQASLDSWQSQEAVREEKVQTKALAEQEQHCKEIMALESQLIASRKEVTKLHKQLLKLRQDLGILRAARDFYRNRKVGTLQPGGIVSNISTKVKFKTARLRGPLHHRSHRAVSPNQVINWQGRSPSPTKDEWEDMSVESDIGEEFSDSLNSVSSKSSHLRRHAERKSYRCSMNSERQGVSYRNKRNTFSQDDKQHEPWEQGTREERRRCRSRRKLTKTRCCSSSASLQHRVESLQRHVYILQSARKDALLSARELQTVNEKISAQLSSLTEKLSGSKQVIQKLTSDLAGVVQQKKVLEMELEQWRQSTFPQQPAPPAPPPAVPVNTECCCQGRTKSPPTDSALQALEAEVKQLQTKLKNTSAEVTKQVAANKALRGLIQEKDDTLQQLQDKLSHVERDVNMKRQLVDDLKTRLKFLQEMEKSYRGQLEDLEKKVKTLSEEATNRKALIDSLKRRLNVATTEKKQREASCTKLTEDLEKKGQQIRALQARIGSSEQALEALEQTASKQMEGLTQKSSDALDRLQRQLGVAYSQLEQLHSFIKALASEILLDVKEVKQQLMKRRRMMQTSTVAVKGALSAKSMIKAKSIAASILNLSENDLADMLDTDQGAEVLSVTADQEWLDQLKHILQQKIPSASQLMETVHVKMKERKVLTEELAMLTTPVSEKA